MADISKRIEKAEKYLQKGKIEMALEEYLSILDDDPGNDVVRQTAAEVFLQVNRSAEAAALLSEIFDRQIAAGDNVKAGVTYKRMARLGPPKLGQTLRFAQASERSGNRREALEAYNAAVTGFLAERRENEALSALRRIAALEANEENLKRLADLAGKLKDRNAAGEAFLKIGIAEEQDGRIGFSWFEKAYQQDPLNPDIAFRYGKGLLDKGEVKRALKILESATKSGSHPDHREAHGLALLAAGKPLEAYSILVALLDKNPGKLEETGALMTELLSEQHYKQALDLAQKLGAQQLRQGTLREYLTFLREITRSHPPDAAFLEYLAELFNSANREHDYCDALVQLFDLRYAAGDFVRAAEALDRAAEVDPYTKGLANRLELLHGKIDEHRHRAISSRLQGAKTEASEPAAEEEEPSEIDSQPTVLEDLMLQAEIFLQYSMRSKALERLERIQKLFPREEEKNDKLRQLYLSAGIEPPSANGEGAATPPSALAEGPAQQSSPAAALSGEDAIDNFARVTEITRNIYRQSNVKSVLFAAVNDVGRHWNASRCVAGLCSPGKPPSAALEYCGPGVKQSDVISIVRLIGALQNIAVQRGSVVIEDAEATPDLASIRQHVDMLELKSLLACPLHDGDQQVGILILEQIDKPRKWRSADVVVLKTIADQMVLAVNNAKLRNLMKTLAVTDEKSGLLKRASYIDVMMAEVKRSLQQSAAMTLMLLNFGRISILARGAGEAAVESMMQNIGQSVSASIRQTDTAVRYDRTSIALILGDTKDTNSFFVIDKLRKMIANIKVPGTENPVNMTAGIAGAVIHKDYDPVDIVTEVINRAEQALEVAHSQGPNSAHAMAPILETAAIA